MPYLKPVTNNIYVICYEGKLYKKEKFAETRGRFSKQKVFRPTCFDDVVTNIPLKHLL
jgi:hypothetical protein